MMTVLLYFEKAESTRDIFWNSVLSFYELQVPWQLNVWYEMLKKFEKELYFRRWWQVTLYLFEFL